MKLKPKAVLKNYFPVFFVIAYTAEHVAFTTFDVKYIYYESTFWIHNIFVVIGLISIWVAMIGWGINWLDT